MKRLLTLLAALLAGTAALAQGTLNDLETDFGGRISAGADYKIAKGLHLDTGVELRSRDNFSNLGRVMGEVGLSYKVLPWMKASAGYVFIEHQNAEGSWKTRHRFHGDLTGTLKAGKWRFSLRERLQLTCKSVGNAYQTTPNSLALKSRLKVSYKGFKPLTPYGFVEARAVLNDPACSATWNGEEYSNYSFKGYTDAYFNRFRGGLGLEWKLDKRNALDFYLMTDYCYDKNIDTDAAGETLRSLTWDQTLRGIAGVEYKFSF